MDSDGERLSIIMPCRKSGTHRCDTVPTTYKRRLSLMAPPTAVVMEQHGLRRLGAHESRPGAMKRHGGAVVSLGCIDCHLVVKVSHETDLSFGQDD